MEFLSLHFGAGGRTLRVIHTTMSDFNPDNPSDSEGDDDLGGLAWTEFDWERYLREQDDVIHRYIGFYELTGDAPDRLEKVARHMGWAFEGEADDEDDTDDDSDDDDDIEPYTIHKNCIYVATKAIFLKLTREWERMAGDAKNVPQPLAVAFTGALGRAESHAVLAAHALDFGDFAMAVSLYKRAHAAISRAISMLDENAGRPAAALAQYRERAVPMLFDLREITLMMMRDCRKEIDSPAADDDE